MTGSPFDGLTVAELRERIADLDDEIASRQVDRREARAALHRKLYANCAAARRLAAPRDRRTGRPLENPDHPAFPKERD